MGFFSPAGLEQANNVLILASGVARVGVGSIFCYMAYLTRHNPHPIGKFVTPRMFNRLGWVFLNDGVRAICFFFGISIAVFFSLLGTFLLCLLLLQAVSDVKSKLMIPRKDAR